MKPQRLSVGASGEIAAGLPGLRVLIVIPVAVIA